MTLAERRVAGFLRSQGIAWRYEPGLFVIDPEGRPRLWTPDFFLPDLGIYVEVVGRPGADYDFRREVYERNQIPILFVRTGDDPNWMDHFREGIVAIHADRARLVERICGRGDRPFRPRTEARRRSVGKGRSDRTRSRSAVNRVDGEGGFGAVKCEENGRKPGKLP
jgi:hypothetical protein